MELHLDVYKRQFIRWWRMHQIRSTAITTAIPVRQIVSACDQGRLWIIKIWYKKSIQTCLLLRFVPSCNLISDIPVSYTHLISPHNSIYFTLHGPVLLKPRSQNPHIPHKASCPWPPPSHEMCIRDRDIFVKLKFWNSRFFRNSQRKVIMILN